MVIRTLTTVKSYKLTEYKKVPWSGQHLADRCGIVTLAPIEDMKFRPISYSTPTVYIEWLWL